MLEIYAAMMVHTVCSNERILAIHVCWGGSMMMQDSTCLTFAINSIEKNCPRPEEALCYAACGLTSVIGFHNVIMLPQNHPNLIGINLSEISHHYNLFHNYFESWYKEDVRSFLQASAFNNMCQYNVHVLPSEGWSWTYLCTFLLWFILVKQRRIIVGNHDNPFHP